MITNILSGELRNPWKRGDPPKKAPQKNKEEQKKRPREEKTLMRKPRKKIGIKKTRGRDSWDEAQNCSDYATEAMRQAVSQRLQQRGLSCPLHPSCFAAAGVAVAQKAQECSELQKNDQWNEASTTGLSAFDHFRMKLETLVGISGMSLHYIARDARAEKK